MRILCAHLEPLPHQITAVYGAMLPRQPLRFLLADDPGAGKTIMAGLFIKELMIRGDVGWNRTGSGRWRSRNLERFSSHRSESQPSAA